MSLNDAIRNLEIRHQVNLARLSSATLQKLSKLLDRADVDIVETLIRRGSATQGTFTSKRLEALLDSIRTINRDAHTLLGRELRKELREIGNYEVGFQKALIEGALPMRWDIVTPTSQTLQAVVNSRPFQGKLLKEWVSELDANKARRLRDAIRLGVVNGETIDQIVRRVRGTRALNYKDGIMAMGRRGAEALVRTAVSHTTTAARDLLYEQNADLISKEQWVATLDTRTCPQCMGLDGKTFELGKGVKTPAHIGCRCVRVPVIKSWRELGLDIDELPPGTRASMNGQVSATETYGTWLKKQGAEVQDDVLGPARAKMFREGLGVESFTNRAGDALTLEQLRARAA
jgi:SPP1 gp7 family putative phage head morphogenesis protein